jgi:hypothetical protein
MRHVNKSLGHMLFHINIETEKQTSNFKIKKIIIIATKLVYSTTYTWCNRLPMKYISDILQIQKFQNFCIPLNTGKSISKKRLCTNFRTVYSTYSGDDR